MELEKEVKEFIDKIEIKFLDLWNTLSYFKGLNLKDTGEKAVNFQSDLANCQFSIDKKFREVRSKKKEVRRSRKSYTKEDYLLFDKQLSNCENALENLIYLGKSLGDAFVWFFFQNDRDILDEHLLHQDEFLMPSGNLGRVGEMGFLQNIKMIDDNLVIYHGITSILRVGDFSLVNLKTHRFTGISELKTDKKNGDNVSVRFITFGSKEKVEPLFSKYSKKTKNLQIPKKLKMIKTIQESNV
jgi:hypothetical protein